MKNVFLLMLLMPVFAWGQVVTVYDQVTRLPLEQVSISTDHNAHIITNAKGQVSITALKGESKISFRIIGHKTLVKSYAQIEASAFEIFMEPAAFNLDEVVVSATRWQQTAKDIPSRITTISSKEMALQNPQTAADLLAASGEVTIQKSQQGGGSPMIRGFSSNRLLYTIDGIRMNTAIFRSGNIQNVISLDPLAIENTEVFFGPGSVIYGSDAIGGVMAFRTLTPKFTTDSATLISGKAFTRTSTANNERTGHVDLNIGWKKLALVSSITHSDYGNLKMGKKGRDEYLSKIYVQTIDNADRVITNEDPTVQKPTGYSQVNMMQKARYATGENLDLQYAFHYSETSSYSRYDRLIERQTNGLPVSAVWNYGPQKWMMNQLSLNHSNSIWYDDLSIRLALQYFEESRIDRNFSGSNRFRLRTQQEEVRATSANMDLVKSWGTHKIFYGIEAVQNKVNSIGSAINTSNGEDIPTPDRYPRSTWNSTALYVNYQLKASERVLLQAGSRYSRFSIHSDFTRHLSFYPFEFATASLKNDALTGSLGMVFSPDNSTRISMNASTGFRAPNVDDIGKIFDFTAGEVVVPNANLKGEYVYNAELNLAKVFNDKLKLDLTGYYTQLENALVRRAFTVNGKDSILYNGSMRKVYAIQNAASANVYGFHAAIEIKLLKGFGFSSLYNYQKGYEEMSNGERSRSRHAAPAFGVSKLKYNYAKLRLEFNAMYTAGVNHENLNPEEQQKPAIYAKDENGNPFSPSWYTLNFKMLYDFTKHFTLSAGLENITDQRYRTYSSGIVAPGRNFVLALRANW